MLDRMIDRLPLENELRLGLYLIRESCYLWDCEVWTDLVFQCQKYSVDIGRLQSQEFPHGFSCTHAIHITCSFKTLPYEYLPEQWIYSELLQVNDWLASLPLRFSAEPSPAQEDEHIVILREKMWAVDILARVQHVLLEFINSSTQISPQVPESEPIVVLASLHKRLADLDILKGKVDYVADKFMNAAFFKRNDFVPRLTFNAVHEQCNDLRVENSALREEIARLKAAHNSEVSLPNQQSSRVGLS